MHAIEIIIFTYTPVVLVPEYSSRSLPKASLRTQNSSEPSSPRCSWCNHSFVNNQPQALSHPLKLPDFGAATLCNYPRPLPRNVCVCRWMFTSKRLSRVWLRAVRRKLLWPLHLHVSGAVITRWRNWLGGWALFQESNRAAQKKQFNRKEKNLFGRFYFFRLSSGQVLHCHCVCVRLLHMWMTTER